MTRRLMQWNRIATPAARRRVRDFATVAGVSAAIAAAWLVAGVTRGAASQRPVDARPIAPSVALLSDVPSHDGHYRASMIPSPDAVSLGRPLAWTVEVRTAAGAPVEDATLELESWMPDEDRMGARPRAAEYLGDGRWRVEGLRFDRLGWWNVKLAISAPAATDSLAFNVVF
jgi:hypothetical protein